MIVKGKLIGFETSIHSKVNTDVFLNFELNSTHRDRVRIYGADVSYIRQLGAFIGCECEWSIWRLYTPWSDYELYKFEIKTPHNNGELTLYGYDVEVEKYIPTRGEENG